jgi:hypothetical protein
VNSEGVQRAFERMERRTQAAASERMSSPEFDFVTGEMRLLFAGTDLPSPSVIAWVCRMVASNMDAWRKREGAVTEDDLRGLTVAAFLFGFECATDGST